MTDNQLTQWLYIAKVALERYQEYLRMLALINKLPPPTELPDDWDAILKEPATPDEVKG